jgi:hypothetical protein
MKYISEYLKLSGVIVLFSPIINLCVDTNNQTTSILITALICIVMIILSICTFNYLQCEGFRLIPRKKRKTYIDEKYYRNLR